MELIRQSCAVALVLALLWWAVTWLKRRGYAIGGTRLRISGNPRELEIIERLALSSQHSLHLVRLNQRVILLGLHPAGFTLLLDTGGDATPTVREIRSK